LVIVNVLFYCVGAAVSFTKSEYRVAENVDEPLQLVLVLSNPSSANISVEVVDKSNTAIGK